MVPWPLLLVRSQAGKGQTRPLGLKLPTAGTNDN